MAESPKEIPSTSDYATRIVVVATRLHDALYYSDAETLNRVIDVAPGGFRDAFIELQRLLLRGE